MDMGGASTQLTFPANDVLGSQYALKWGKGSPVSLYTHSYLNYGTNEVWKNYQKLLYTNALSGRLRTAKPWRKVPDYCRDIGFEWTYPSSTDTNKITFEGKANPALCIMEIQNLKLLRQDSYCAQEPCAVAGAYQPAVPDNVDLYGVSSYAYVATSLDCATDFSQANPQAKTIGCLKEQIQNKCTGRRNDAAMSEDDRALCFRGAYFYRLLTQGYGMKDDRLIFFPAGNKVNGAAASWAMGAALFEAKLLPKEASLSVTTTSSASSPTTTSASRHPTVRPATGFRNGWIRGADEKEEESSVGNSEGDSVETAEV